MTSKIRKIPPTHARTRLENPGGRYPSEKSLFIDGFAPPSPPMATVFALVLETAFTSVRRSARRVAPFPLICPPILPRDPAPRTSLHGTTGMSVRLAHMLWCSHTARHCPELPALSLEPIYNRTPDSMHICNVELPLIAMNSRLTLVWQAPTTTS